MASISFAKTVTLLKSENKMMIRKLFISLLSILSFSTAVAQQLAENQRLVGYSTTDSITISGAAFGQAGTYTIGALLSPQMLSSYSGCKIVGLRIAAATNLGRSRTFIYNIANGSMQPVIEQNQRLYEGWNSIYFNGEGITINDNDHLFFGFDYVETQEMISADMGGLCCVGSDVDGGFYYYGSYNNRTDLFQITDVGCLCVQLIVDISSLPLYDLDIDAVDAGFKYKKPGENIDALITYSNVGRKDISNYQLAWQIDNATPVIQTFNETVRSGATENWVFTNSLPDDISVGMHTFRVYAVQVENEPLPEKSKNDTITQNFAIYRDTLKRSQVYFEIYNDQTSPYSSFLNEAVKLLPSDIAAIVNVHRPGTPLAVQEAGYLHQLYAYDWPTFTVNRAYFPGEANIAYDMNDYLPVIGADMTAGIINDMLWQDYLNPSFASVSLNAAYNEASRELSITATGRLLAEAKAIYGDLALTLMAVEDSVVSSQVVYNLLTGRSSTQSRYVHDRVLRGYLTAPTGDAISAEGENYSIVRSMTLPEGWNPRRLSIVALLTKKATAITDDNVTDYDVINANSLRLSDSMPSAIELTKADTPTVSTYYSLDGKRLSSLPAGRGLFIERRADGTVRKTFKCK